MARLKHEAAKEMSDVICYLDLLASRMGIDLEKAIIEKFNEVSDRKGCKIKL
jgi:NTP pyrophosphatase (non-canonical NTP hydrolase)